jgi:hypothetical protein
MHKVARGGNTGQKAGHEFDYFARKRNLTTLHDIARVAKPLICKVWAQLSIYNNLK